MDTNLPNLDIVEDIKEIMNDEPTPEKIQETIETVENHEEDNSPFVQKSQPTPPTNGKKKKELSEKQKAHLEKIRKLAFEKKREKAKAKREALEKVNAEHKPRSYKPRKPKNAKTEEQKNYEDKTIKTPTVLDKIQEPREEPNIKNSTPDDFVPSHKQELEKKKKYSEEQEKMSFINFMGNMEKYLILKDDYDRNKRNSQNNKTYNNKTTPKPQPVEKPKPIPIQPPKPPNPFENYFG